ncbi:MAG TPA: ribosome maturation factor RimM [Stellaceae bacterium]|nr:ribosome maturation factor RimM [Stellaceae bacterium]
MISDKRVCVGVITGAQGVRGAVRVKSFTADPADVARYGPLADEPGEREFHLSFIGNAKGVIIAKIAGIDDRDRAETLRGLRLYVPRTALPPTQEDEYYHADLIGLNAVLADGAPLGRVRAVHDFGAGDTLEIARAAGQPVMVPFTRAIVPVVDMKAGRLVIDPPPGLLDDPSHRKADRHPRESGGPGGPAPRPALDSRFRGTDDETATASEKESA